MIGLIHEAETHGATIDEKTQVSIILESLTPCFKQFTTNYVMNKLQFNMTQLLNELSVFEHLNKDKSKEVEANNVDTKSNPSSDKKRKREDKDKSISKPKKEKKAPKAKKNKKKPKSKAKEPQGKCFHCVIVSHWKRNCKKYLSELKKKGKLDLPYS